MVKKVKYGQVHHYERNQMDSFLLGCCLRAYGGEYILAHLIRNLWLTRMWTYRCDAPLVNIWPVSLNLLVSAGSSVPIMPSSYIDSFIHHARGCISHTFKVKKQDEFPSTGILSLWSFNVFLCKTIHLRTYVFLKLSFNS